MDSLTFLDPEDHDLLAGDTQGDDFRFNFSLPSQSQVASHDFDRRLDPFGMNSTVHVRHDQFDAVNEGSE